jgi:hypothetical protein
MAVKPIPDGYHRVQPYLLVPDVAGQIEFLTNIFGAREIMRTTGGSGGTHAEVRIGESVIMMGGDSTPGWMPMPSALYVYCEDVDSTYQRSRGRRDLARRACRQALRRSRGRGKRRGWQHLVDRYARQGCSPLKLEGIAAAAAAGSGGIGERLGPQRECRAV